MADAKTFVRLLHLRQTLEDLQFLKLQQARGRLAICDVAIAATHDQTTQLRQQTRSSLSHSALSAAELQFAAEQESQLLASAALLQQHREELSQSTLKEECSYRVSRQERETIESIWKAQREQARKESQRRESREQDELFLQRRSRVTPCNRENRSQFDLRELSSRIKS